MILLFLVMRNTRKDMDEERPLGGRGGVNMMSTVFDMLSTTSKWKH
jgi:hypothetical protein